MDKELLDAVKDGDLDGVRDRLDAGADIDGSTYPGETALCYASRYGHLDIVKLLLTRRAKVSGPDIVDPIIFAVSMGHSEIVSRLLEEGSGPNLRDKHGTPLVATAARRGYDKIVSALVAYQADINLANKFGSTPLIEAVLGAGLPSRHTAVIAALLASGADVNHRNSYDIITEGGATALILAACVNRLDIVEQLVQAGANVTIKDDKGRTALSHAIERGNDSIAAFLERKHIHKMTLWRLNIKTASRPGFDARRFCLENNFLGIGWPAEEAGNAPRDFEHYVELGNIEYSQNGDNGWWTAVNAIGNKMEVGDLCWTRDTAGVYYIGKVFGEWRYIHSDEADNYDIHNVRLCQWRRVGLVDAVPGAVERSFGPSRTLQPIKDATAATYSQYLYYGRAMHPDIAFDPFSLFSPADHEDLAALYLQDRGYYLLPSTVKKTTAVYEWVMRHKQTGMRAVLQVKSGAEAINLEQFPEQDCKVFVVAADNAHYGIKPDNVILISRNDLLTFALQHRQVLSERITHILDWAVS
jgi:ankyrin repeat protein